MTKTEIAVLVFAAVVLVVCTLLQVAHVVAPLPTCSDSPHACAGY